MRTYSRRLKTGLYWYVDYTNEKGKRVRRAVGRRKKDAELFLSKIRMKMFEGKYDEIPQPQKFASAFKFMERYLEYREGQSPGFRKKDNGRFRTIARFFEDNKITYLNQIAPGMVQKLQTEYLKTHSHKSWNVLLERLKAMLNRAVEWDELEVNPISKLKPLRLDRTFHYFTKEECDLMLDKADEPLKTALTILLNTGIRRSELWNLRWRDVDMDNRKIEIKPYKGYSTKSKRIRVIPISDNLLNALQENKNRGYVCRPYGNINTLYKKFQELLKTLDITGNLHDLRHTFASHLAMAGESIVTIKDLLGHSSITTTMIYAHLSPEIHRKAIEKLPY